MKPIKHCEAMARAGEGAGSSFRLKSESSPFWGGITQTGWKEGASKQRSGRNMSQAERQQLKVPKARRTASMAEHSEQGGRVVSEREAGATLCRAVKDMSRGEVASFLGSRDCQVGPSPEKNDAKLKNHH